MTAGSSNFIKLGVSAEALEYSYRAKIQMLLVLMETLDFDNLLQMIHDEIPLRQVCYLPIAMLTSCQWNRCYSILYDIAVNFTLVNKKIAWHWYCHKWLWKDWVKYLGLHICCYFGTSWNMYFSTLQCCCTTSLCFLAFLSFMGHITCLTYPIFQVNIHESITSVA